MRSRPARFRAHLCNGGWQLRRAFPAAVLDAIEARITAGEQRHGAELRFVVEARLPARAIWSRLSPRARAGAVFAELGVWDTASNNGVLVHVLLADHAVEIVADRGARALVNPSVWDEACATMTQSFATGAFEEGTLRAIDLLNEALAGAFPPLPGNSDELPNRPLVR